MFKIMTMKLIAPIIDEIPTMYNEKIVKSNYFDDDGWYEYDDITK